MPTGSAFGPLIWNILQKCLMSMNVYADDHQFYALGNTLADVHDDLAVCAESASSQYGANFLKGNLGKYQKMALGSRKESIDIILT